MSSSELGAQLRVWRDRLAPDAVGLAVQPRRRAPGLGREEVAQLAGISGDYLVRLEQGRAHHPSAQVVGALVQALRLDDEESDRLFRTAGHAPPRSDRMMRQVTASIVRIVDRLGETPVTVIDAAWETVLQNRAADALFGDVSAQPGRGRNRAWRKTLRHPVAGELTLDCDVLGVHGSDLQIVVFTAQPGSPEAEAVSTAIAVGSPELPVGATG